MIDQKVSLILDPAISLIKEVGEFIKMEATRFDRSMVKTKGLNDLVSYVDKEAEVRLIRGLKKLLPNSGFVAEEGTEEQTNNDYQWIVDPLDGTTNFIHGIPVYSVSVALTIRKKLVLGIVYEINKDECFWGSSEGAFCNDKPIQVSDQKNLSDGIIATGFPYNNFENLSGYMNILTTLMKSCHGIRLFGSAAVDLAYVACGRFEGFFEYNLNPWDVAAGAFIVECAGGKVTDFKSGNDFIFGRHIVAGNETHAELLQIVQDNW